MDALRASVPDLVLSWCILKPSRLSPSDVFALQIPMNARVDVSNLKQAIKATMHPDLDGLSILQFNLLKPKVPIPLSELDSVEVSFDEHIPGDADPGRFDTLWSCTRLEEVFYKALEKGGLHLLVQLPRDLHVSVPSIASSQGDEDRKARRLQLLEEHQARAVEAARRALPPAEGALPLNFRDQQRIAPILNGRPAELRAMPVCLYNSVFADFKADLANVDLSITHNQYAWTSDLRTLWARPYATDEERRTATLPFLEAILGSKIETTQTEDKLSSDYAIVTRVGGVELVRGVIEWQNEMGSGGVDPSIKGALSYRKYWAQKKLDSYRKACPCPAFIISIAGPWMAIHGAAFTEYAAAEPLTDFVRIGAYQTEEMHLYDAARTLVALRNGLQALDDYYKRTFPDIPTPPAPTGERFFPWLHEFVLNRGVDGAEEGETVTMEYITKLADDSPVKPIYRARRSDTGAPLVVKFVQRYNAAAHALLASRGMAPRLLHAGPGIGDLQLVVMEYIQGTNAEEAFGGNVLPPSVFTQVERAVATLHSGKFVFWDLRSANVMIAAEDERPLMIDFDWCGVDGETVYPVSTNDMDVDWHPGVRRGEPMRCEHDLWMLEKMRPTLKEIENN